MSGRDGTPNSHTPTGGTSGGVDCSQLSFDTYISSPKSAAIHQITTSTILQIDVYRQGNTETVAVFIAASLIIRQNF